MVLELGRLVFVDSVDTDKENTMYLVKIGELSKLVGLPVTTLRDWANNGHLPVAVCSPSGTRWFNPQECIDAVDFKKREIEAPTLF